MEGCYDFGPSPSDDDDRSWERDTAPRGRSRPAAESKAEAPEASVPLLQAPDRTPCPDPAAPTTGGTILVAIQILCGICGILAAILAPQQRAVVLACLSAAVLIGISLHVGLPWTWTVSTPRRSLRSVGRREAHGLHSWADAKTLVSTHRPDLLQAFEAAETTFRRAQQVRDPIRSADLASLARGISSLIANCVETVTISTPDEAALAASELAASLEQAAAAAENIRLGAASEAQHRFQTDRNYIAARYDATSSAII